MTQRRHDSHPTRASGGQIALLATLLFSMIVHVGCESEPVTSRDLLGAWYADSVSVSHLPPEFKATEPEIQLFGDGSFAASDIPDRIVFGGISNVSELVSGSGSWKVDTVYGGAYLMLRYESFEGITGRNTPWGVFLNTFKRKGRIEIFSFLGDPDSAPRFVFRRKPE